MDGVQNTVQTAKGKDMVGSYTRKTVHIHRNVQKEGESGREIGQVGGRVASFSVWVQEEMYPDTLKGKMGYIPPCFCILALLFLQPLTHRGMPLSCLALSAGEATPRGSPGPCERCHTGRGKVFLWHNAHTSEDPHLVHLVCPEAAQVVF